jgi:hypothetical protein
MSSTTTGIVRIGRSGLRHRTDLLGWRLSGRISRARFVDAICSAVCSTNTGQLHERLCARHTLAKSSELGRSSARTRKGRCQSIGGDDLRVEQNGRGSQTGIAGNRATSRRRKPEPLRAAACLTFPPNSARSLARLLDHRRDADSRAVCAASGPRGDRPGGSLGQAVAGGLLFWRGPRLREAPAAPVVAPGLRPRFFSVLPTPANFRSR